MPHNASSQRPPRLTPAQLQQRARDGQEIAILDVREEGVFARGHLLLAANLPSWRLELLILAAVPRRDTRIVLVDGDETLAGRAAEKLAEIGYTDLSILAGGTAAWKAAGHALFTGIHVVSKAFGELVESQLGTPHISADELLARRARGDDLVVVDGRTPEEFARFSLPDAFGLPNGELPWRIHELAPDPRTLVVVNCAGRTRSIIGAQTLIDAGLPNPVVALENGTMAWLQGGQPLRHGAVADLREPMAARPGAAQRAQALARQAGARWLSGPELAELAADESRTLYLFDTRTREEYEAGHLQGWRWAPGGQLIQGTDAFIGTRHARIVLSDWDGVRAPTTAAWLSRLGGWEVYLHAPDASGELETGPEPVRTWSFAAGDGPLWLSPRQTEEWLRQGSAVLFDVDSSLAFQKQHPAGARFAAPDRLPEFIADLPFDSTVVVTSADGRLARHVAVELRRHHPSRPTRALTGGNQAWAAAGLPVAQGREDILTDDDDDWYSPYAYVDEARRQAAFREYLSWEIGLAEQVAREGDFVISLQR